MFLVLIRMRPAANAAGIIDARDCNTDDGDYNPSVAFPQHI
jgi:hypothetical protein